MVRQKKEESVPVQEVETQTVLSVKHYSKSVLIVLLSLFCVLIGALIYHLSQPMEDLKSVPTGRLEVSKKQPHQPKASVVFRQSQTPAPRAIETEPKPAPTPDLTPAKPQMVMTELPTSSAPEPIKVIPPDPPVTLEDLLQLRDHLRVGQSCLADLKIVMKKHLPDADEKDRLVEKLMPVCTVRSVFDSIEDAFYKNRKKALMTYYRLNNPTWLAYLKTFGASLVDVRRLEPSKEKPKDIISMAQNDLNAKNLAGAVQKIQKLPPEMRTDFDDFMNLADTYLAAQKETESLILSFGRKGE